MPVIHAERALRFLEIDDLEGHDDVPLRGLRSELPPEPPRVSATVAPRRLLRHGMLGYVGSFLSAVVVGSVLDLPTWWLAGLLVVVGGWLAYSWAALPTYRRAFSLRPASGLLAVLAALALAFLVLELDRAVARPGLLRDAVLAGLLSVVVFIGSAYLHRWALRRRSTILVGDAEPVNHLLRRWSDHRDIDVVHSFTWSDAGERSQAIRDVIRSVAELRADSVVIASPTALSSASLRHLAWALQRTDIECLVVADMNDYVEDLTPRRFGDQVALSLTAPYQQRVAWATKSAIDRLVAGLGLIVLSPVLVVVAGLIRLTSEGPVIFRQVRTGRDGVPFTMYKFRTMVPDAEARLAELSEQNEGAGPLFKLSADPRITRVGRVLRKTSIDELPQLINVVLGQMSLVGPRPALPAETAEYSRWVWRRLHVKPGLTGLWQVSGRSHLSWEESIRKDLQYVNNWSLGLDAVILAKTVKAVVASDGAM